MSVCTRAHTHTLHLGPIHLCTLVSMDEDCPALTLVSTILLLELNHTTMQALEDTEPAQSNGWDAQIVRQPHTDT